MGESTNYRNSRRALDYLLAVYIASLGKNAARLTEISGILGVSAPSAHEYLAELVVQGLVTKTGRGLYKLTSTGRKILMRRIWAHGVLEEMLVRIFKIDIEAACSIASQIDLEVGEKNVEQICSVLGHPRTCPHGNTIPHVGESAEKHMGHGLEKPCIRISGGAIA